MRRVARFLLPIALLAVLSGCKTASLSYAQGELSLQVNQNHLKVNGTTLSSRNDSFGNLYLRQKIIKLKDGSTVVYERARTDDLYEFNLLPMQTVRILFDAYKMNIIYSKSSFYLVQMILRDGRTLNIAVEQFDDQQLSFVYGMNNAQFRNMLTQLDPQATQKPLIEEVTTLPVGNGAIFSRWSVRKVQFVPLITPVRYVFGL